MHYAALLGAVALFSTAFAAPVKRDVETQTVTEIDTVVEMVTAVVWVDPTDVPAPTTQVEYYTAPAPVHTTSSSPAPSPPAPVKPTTTSQAPVIKPTTTSQAPVVQPTTTSQPPPPPPAPTTTTQAPPPAPPTSTSIYVAPAPTSVYVAPAPPAAPTSEYVAPAPATTETPAPAPTTTAQAPPAAAPTQASSAPSGNTYTGDITYYDVGLGSCGITNSDSEMVVAMSAALMNKATMCGKTITMSLNGVTKTATVVDTCPGCASGSLDLSPAAFSAIAPSGDGRVHNVQWWFN